jgi:sulfofructose kinase
VTESLSHTSLDASPVLMSMIGIGIAAKDYLALVDPYPKQNSKTEALETSIQGGGPVPTAIATAARLGLKSSLIAVTGDDEEGRFVKSQLDSIGVDTESIIIDPTVRTPRAFIWVDRGTGHRSVVLDQQSSRIPRPEELDIDRIQTADILLVDGRGFLMTQKALQAARAAGTLTMMDAGSNRENMAQLLPLIDYVICSETFAVTFTGVDDPEQALREIRSFSKGKIVITLGDKGVIAHDGRDLIQLDRVQVPVKDTTGAGDVFHGAFAAGLGGCFGKADFRTCLTVANTAAALSCRALGGRAGIPAAQEVKNRIHHHDR